MVALCDGEPHTFGFSNRIMFIFILVSGFVHIDPILIGGGHFILFIYLLIYLFIWFLCLFVYLFIYILVHDVQKCNYASVIFMYEFIFFVTFVSRGS